MLTDITFRIFYLAHFNKDLHNLSILQGPVFYRIQKGWLDDEEAYRSKHNFGQTFVSFHSTAILNTCFHKTRIFALTKLLLLCEASRIVDQFCSYAF
jgi:hypothetical protein